MSSTINEHINEALEKQNAQGLFRFLRSYDQNIDFCSNDYLSLARSKELKESIASEIATFNGSQLLKLHGSTASRLVCGESEYVNLLETELAEFYEQPAALIFNSGYQANQGILSCLVPRQGTIIYDSLSHASMIDGIRLSTAKAFSFQHNDLQDLESKLEKATQPILVAVEGLYSMNGDTAPLKELCTLCAEFSAQVFVDEAHSSGIYGDRGQGIVAALGLEKQIFARLHTFGKALGTHGAAVVGSQKLKEYLINFCRSFIYSTALPNQALAGIRCAHKLLPGLPARKVLWENIELYQNLKAKNSMPANSGPIQAWLFEGNQPAMLAAQKLREKNFAVKAILSPTVPKGQERIRVCLHAHNSPAQIEELVKSLL